MSISKINSDLECIAKAWDIQDIQSKISELNNIIAQEDFWSDQQKAVDIMKTKALCESRLSMYQSFCDDYELLSLEDPDTVSDQITVLAKKVAAQKLRCLFGEIDEAGCFLEVRSGAGGTEANDWAEMLFRMYIRYAQKAGYKIEIMEEVAAERAGIDWGLVKILPSGVATHPYGFLKNEAGSHRLVRISPFDSNANRHTSFAGVDVVPLSDKTIKIEILDKDLEIKACRASGAGGQHVNKTNSAVRVVHLPTKIVAESQQERSFHQNLDHAMTLLKSRLYAAELNKQKQIEQERLSARGEITWGNQIRSYVLQPYQLVVDLRTRYEETNALKVLEGDIQGFLDASVEHGI